MAHYCAANGVYATLYCVHRRNHSNPNIRKEKKRKNTNFVNVKIKEFRMCFRLMREKKQIRIKIKYI